MSTEAPVIDATILQAEGTAPSVPEAPAATPNAPIPFNTSQLAAEEAPASTDGLEEYGFDSEDVRRFEFDLYRGKKGITDRIGILALPFGGRVHFKKGLGYVMCLSQFKSVMVGGKKVEQTVKRAACCDHMDAARKRFAVPVIHYATAPDGKLIPNQQFTYALKGWIYNDVNYEIMRRINSEFSLLEHDILVACEDESFQKITITACRNKLIKADVIPANVKEDVATWVATMRPKIAAKVGRKMSEQELKEKLGLAAPAAAQVAPQDAPLIDVKSLLD